LTAVVPNGIDIDELRKLGSVEPKNIPSGEGLCVLIPASFYENKSQDTAIKGLAEYLSGGGDACLWLAGDVVPGAPKDYKQKLHNLVGQLRLLDRVHFLGWRGDLPAVMSKCDVVALTSKSEGLPRVIIEAMCLKKPVIGTRAGGIPEVFRDGIEGRIIEVDDSRGFAAALEELSDPELRRRMGQAGQQRVKSRFDIKVIAPRYYELISKIC
jgi:glycosyltransferase involved in cell wall biosynthesis